MGTYFDWRYDLQSMWRGMSRDLQHPVGTIVPWFVYDAADTKVDSIYDVGASTGGRVWQPPRYLAVMSAVKLEGQEVANDRGQYLWDTLRLVFSVKAARNVGLGHMVLKPDQHASDRVVFEGKVFEVNQVRIRGDVKSDYAVVGANATQVKNEELVNDSSFWQQYIPTDNG